MKNILITGGAGFIGGSLAERLLESEDYYVVLIDNLATGNIQNLPQNHKDRWTFIRCNANRYDEIAPIMARYGFDFVFHYGAVVGVQRTLQHPVLVLDDIQGIKNVLDLSKSTGVNRVFFSSSSEVYGEPVQLPQNEETTPLNSRLPYAVVKNVGEAFCRSYELEYDLDYTILRFFNTYGPKQSDDFVISRFLRAASSGRDLTIYGDGSQTRTFCHIDDNLDATISALENDLFVNDMVNVGSNEEISIADLAAMIKRITRSTSNIVHQPALKEGDMTRRLPDISKMRRLLNRELIPLETGLQRLHDSGIFA